MSNLSDKDIDRLSREAADSYEPDATSLSWSRLEQKLVEQMPERPPDGFQFGRISPYIWGPAVVLIAGISFYFVKTNIYSKLSTRTINPVSQINKVQHTDSTRSAAVSIIADSLSVSQIRTAPGTENKTPSAASEATSSLPGASKNNSAESASSLSDAQKADAQSEGQHKAGTGAGTKSSNNDRGSKIIIPSAVLTAGATTSHNPPSGSRSSVSQSTTENTLANSAGKSTTGGSPNGITTTSGVIFTSASSAEKGTSTHEASRYDMPLIISSGYRLGTVAGNDSLLNKMSAQKSPDPHKSVHINRSLSIGFTFGTDYTDAGGISNNQLSNNIGITLGYYLTNKLSVNTGIIYSNKFYWAPGHDQDRRTYPAYGSNTTYAWAPDIEYINGACNIYELPLTLRYDFAKNDKTRFFVNAGASSYFMLKQTNIYFSHNGGGRPYAWLSKEESPSNYWFGVGDLSFGLETDIGKGFSFQAEPFLRIPFQKMGVENLKMYSYGFMLSFRYAPILSRTKR